MKPWMFVESILFSRFHYQALSLNDISADLSTRYNLSISKQALDDRFNACSVKAVKLMLEKFISGINHGSKLESVFTNFGRIRIKDSTGIQLSENMAGLFPGLGGGSSPAAAKIQLEFDLKTGQILDLSLQPLSKNDYTDAWDTRGDIKTGDLIIRDLGYSSIDMFRSIEESHAHYLSRLKPDTAILEKKRDKYLPLDLKELENYLRKNHLNVAEKQVYIGLRKRIPVRLIILPVPEDKIAERKEKHKCKSKRRLSKNNKRCNDSLSLNLFVTNAPSSMLPLEKIYTLYKIRWQIELIFKAWKSIGQIEKLKKARKDRILTLLYLKLLWIMMNMKVVMAISNIVFNKLKKKISMVKAFKIIYNNSDRLVSALHRRMVLEKYIWSIVSVISQKALTEKRKGKYGSLDILISFIG